MKPLLLYTPIFSHTAELFVSKLLDIDASEDQEFWINSPGGSVFAGNSILGALNERTGSNNAKVFGSADSMVAFMLLYMDNVEALDISTFRLHRADGFVDNDQDKALLAKVNKDLRSKMEKRIDAVAFKEVTGYTINDMFDPEKRINIDLDAKKAKKVGLINKIIRLEPKQIAAMNKQFVAFADFNSEVVVEKQGSEQKQTEIKVEQIKIKKMTIQEFQAQHPDIYASVVKIGVEKEKERVEAILMFADIDMTACNEAIAKGETPGPKFYAEMQVKAISANELKAETEETIPPLTTGEEITATSKSKEEIENDEFYKEVQKELGLKVKEVKS